MSDQSRAATTDNGEKTTMRPPIPSLTYEWLRRDGDGVTGDGPPLYEVHEVGAALIGDRGQFYVCATGRMRRKDGQPGPRRGVAIDLAARQPRWLAEIIEDARRRLGVDGEDDRV